MIFKTLLLQGVYCQITFRVAHDKYFFWWSYYIVQSYKENLDMLMVNFHIFIYILKHFKKYKYNLNHF